MTLIDQYKAEKIQRYFDLIHKLNHCDISNEYDAESKLIKLKSENKLMLIELEECRHSLSTANSRKSKASKANVLNLLFNGLVFDAKDSCRFITRFKEGFVLDEFNMLNLLILFLTSLFLLLFVLLLFSSNALEVTVCLTIILFLYTPLTIEAARRRHAALDKNKKQEQKKDLEKRISNLETASEKTQKIIEYLEMFDSMGGVDYVRHQIQCLEVEVKRYLEEDKINLITRGMQELNIKEYEDSENVYQSAKQLEHSPIVSFTGKRSDRAKESSVIITDRELEDVEKKNSDKYIESKDFYEEKGIDERIRYSVYEFVVIFLCDNFLSYYRCYWNSLKRATVDEETCEYLYDSIVSVKTQDKSSLRQQDNSIKRTYRDFLSITTMDGDILYLRLSKDRKERISSVSPKPYVSDIDSAAQLIRYWIRQRRVDYFMIEDRNE